MKNFCVSDIPMESVTLDDMSTIFAEIDERVRRAHSLEEVVPILRESYYRLRTRVLEDYIIKEMENKPIEAKPDADKPDGILVKVWPDESAPDKSLENVEYTPGSNTTAIYCNPGSSFRAPDVSSVSSLPITPIPRPAEVPKEFCKSRADGKVQPGEIIYLNLDGHWRPYRVMANVDGATRLLGLFSIGEINETEPQYLGSLSSQYCDNWCGDIVKRGQNIENHLKLSKMGTLAFYVHIPDWKELQADCKTIAGDLTSAWYNDDDQSNIQVYTGRTGMTSILNGEDGGLYEFHSANSEDNEGCFPFEVRPSLTLRLGSLPYYYDPADRAVLEEFF
jgi:hypothetical protein